MPFSENPPDFQILPCEAPFSFFKEADIYEGREHCPALHRVFSLARKLRAKTLVRERLAAEDWLDDYCEVAVRRWGQGFEAQAWRLSFFDVRFLSRPAIGRVPKESYLGYAVVVKGATASRSVSPYVHESVIKSPELLNNYVHCQGLFEQKIDGSRFQLNGSYFSQQNGLTGCCVHAALRNALMNLPQGCAEKLTDRAMNDVLEIGPEEASQGLTSQHAIRVVQERGLSAHAHNFLDYPELTYTHFAHAFLESGFPVLLSFTTQNADEPGHIVAVAGHTLNTDVWYPEASLAYFVTFPRKEFVTFPSKGYFYLSSSCWIPHLVVQDDNYGMYSCLSSECLRKEAGPDKDPSCRAAYGIGILPQRVSREPLMAELRAVVLLVRVLHAVGAPGVRWLDELRDSVLDRGRAPVLRTVLMPKTEYVEHIMESQDWQGDPLPEDLVRAVAQTLPELCWMVEVSIPELYTANRSKLGEILVDVNAPDPDPATDISKCWIGGRLPGLLFVPPQKPGQLPTALETPVEAHVPIYRLPRLRWGRTEW